MARIRTIKPEFFRHEDLFEAERETGLPLRVAYAGLWTCADREGRFRWNPRALKLDCLPYDEVDFSRVLDALATRGFLVRYRQTTDESSRDFGFIPSWRKHQVINTRERASELPDPADCELTQELPNASSTRAPRDTELHVHAHGEREKEGERERERKRKRERKQDAAPDGALSEELDLGQAERARSPPQQYDPELDLFRRGKDVLGQSAGGLIKRLVQAKDGKIPLARAAIEQASTKHDPREYIGAIIRGKEDDDKPRVIV